MKTFSNGLLIFTKKMEVEIRKEIRNYIDNEVVPLYDSFDVAHRRDHVLTVMSQAMELYSSAPEEIRSGIDPEMLLVAAACHDIGLAYGREHHHTDSARIIRSDSRLREWFSEAQIETIAMAAEDHRASGKSKPRSIYGKIVAEADRVIDPETIIRRTVQFGLTHCPELGPEEQISRVEAHLAEKYGYGGYLRLWIPWSGNAVRLDSLRRLIADPRRLRSEVRRIFFTVV